MPADFRQRVRQELADRTAELDRLSAFCNGPSFAELSSTEQGLLLEQRELMVRFVNVLARRIATFND